MSESVPGVRGGRGGALDSLAQVSSFLKRSVEVGLLFSERFHSNLDLSTLSHRHQAHLNETNGKIAILKSQYLLLGELPFKTAALLHHHIIARLQIQLTGETERIPTAFTLAVECTPTMYCAARN